MRTQQGETAHFIASMAANMAAMAEQVELGPLAYLLRMAEIEARNSTELGMAQLRQGSSPQDEHY